MCFALKLIEIIVINIVSNIKIQDVCLICLYSKPWHPISPFPVCPLRLGLVVCEGHTGNSEVDRNHSKRPSIVYHQQILLSLINIWCLWVWILILKENRFTTYAI
jgi:hypothetical protein